MLKGLINDLSHLMITAYFNTLLNHCFMVLIMVLFGLMRNYLLVKILPGL